MDYFKLKEVEIVNIIGTPANDDNLNEHNEEIAGYSHQIVVSDKLNIKNKIETIIINPETQYGIMVRIGDYIYTIYFKTYDVIRTYSKFNLGKLNPFDPTNINVVSIIHHNGSRLITIIRTYFNVRINEFTSRSLIGIVDNYVTIYCNELEYLSNKS